MDEQQAVAALAAVVGTWDVTQTIRPTSDAAPVVQRAIATNRMVAGRWLVVDHRTESGFEGHGVYGWDAQAGRITGVWVDGAGGGMVRTSGDWDAASRTMTSLCEAVHQGSTRHYREITTTRGDGSRLYRHLVPTPDGGEHELITAVHTRRADEAAPLPLPGPASEW